MDPALAQAIFRPRSLAIVGASDDRSKTSSRPVRYLREGGFQGALYPVNARSPTVMGEQAWPSVDDLPEAPDHAFILLPTEAAIGAVGECGRRGIKVATVLASSFSEAGPEGVEREARLRRTAAEAGIRLVGPSSLGIVNLHHRMALTANAAFAESGLTPGGVFCASQSGSMIGALVSRGKARGVAFAGLVSVGGEVDLGLGALCEATLDDPAVTSYMLFLETLRDAASLRRFAVGAAERGKPIVALKLGRSQAAAELAISHTGSLAGEDDVAAAFLADCGVARVETLEGLLEATPLLRAARRPGRRAAKPTVAVVTTTGGAAAMVVDQLGLRGVDVRGPDAAVLDQIRATGIDVAASRIVDLTLAGVQYGVMKGALEALLGCGQFDMVVAVVGSSARFQPELAVRAVVDVAAEHGRLAVFLAPEAPEALAMLAAAEVPGFRTPEACADAIAATLLRRPARALAQAGPVERPGGAWLDELEGYALLAKLGVASAPAAGLAISPLGRAPGVGYPAAVKVLHRAVAHKSDVGGVVLNVGSDAELAAACDRIAAAVGAARPELTVDRVLVQQMAQGAVGEALVGWRIDPQVGPIVVLAAGGVLTEIYRDRCVRTAPVDLDGAREMIDEVKAMAVLGGFRGRPAGDVEALAQAIVAVSRTGELVDEPVAELEVNPLLVMPMGQGVQAVDVLVRLSASDGPQIGGVGNVKDVYSAGAGEARPD